MLLDFSVLARFVLFWLLQYNFSGRNPRLFRALLCTCTSRGQ